MSNIENPVDAERKIKKFATGHKVWGIVISILMVILGIVLFCVPVRGLIWLEYAATAALVIVGIYLIIKYFCTPKDDRYGWTLANGIILILLGALYLFSSPLVTMVTFSFLFAVLTISDGINLFSLSSRMKKNGESGTGLLIASGILDIILAVFFIIAPFAMNWAIAVIIGIYLVVAGISLFAESCSGKNKA